MTNMMIAGTSLGILIDGSNSPYQLLRISIDGYKLPVQPHFSQKSMGANTSFSYLMGVIVQIDLP